MDRYKSGPSPKKSFSYQGNWCNLEILLQLKSFYLQNVISGFSGGPYEMGPFDGPLAKRSGGRFRFSVEERRLYAMIFIKFCTGLNDISPMKCEAEVGG